MPMKLKLWINNFKKTIDNYLFTIQIVWDSAPWYLMGLIVLTLMESLLPLIPMFLNKDLLNLLVSPLTAEAKITRGLLLLGGIAAIGVFMQLIGGIKGLINGFTLNIVGKKVTYMIQKNAAQLDLKFYDTPDYYQKLGDARRALGKRWDFLLTAPIDVFGKVVSLCTMIGILAALNVYLVPIIICGVTPNIIIQRKTRKKEMDFYSHQIPENRKIAYTESVLSDRYFAKEVRIFGLGDYILQMSQQLFKEQYEKVKKLKLWSFKLNGGWNLLSIATLFGCQVYITLQIIWKKITLGEWQFYFGAAHSIQANLNAIFSILTSSFEEDLYSNILRNFLETQPDIDIDKGKRLAWSNTPPFIEFQNVSFLYPGASQLLLNRISFTIKPGERIALVGLNGSGKSTLIKLLTRLYDPTGGRILFNGVDIREYRPGDLYKLFNVVFQDFSQYAFTFQDNIGISSLERMSDFHEVSKAAGCSGADKIAAKLPNGYNTYITKAFDMEGYSNLSGGEWQKVAIARGFFREAPIMILDEPTASLDPDAEYEIYNKFIQLCKDRTAVLISHKLSSVRMVDRIFLIQDGIIKEAGTHHELMSLNREYARLFRLQAEQFVIPLLA